MLLQIWPDSVETQHQVCLIITAGKPRLFLLLVNWFACVIFASKLDMYTQTDRKYLMQTIKST